MTTKKDICPCAAQTNEAAEDVEDLPKIEGKSKERLSFPFKINEVSDTFAKT